MVSRVREKRAERVSVKLEVVSGVVAVNQVKREATFLSVRKEVELALRGGGPRISRSVGRANPSVTGCFSCSDRGHVQAFC